MKDRSLLVCGAHPDDELFVAGSMARYAASGARITVVCGTRGERGRTADLCSVADLPIVREAELKAAMRILGVAEDSVRFLPYEDQKLSSAPADEVRKQLVRLIRNVHPQVVVSFDLHGLNGHPDHIAMARFTADAVAAAADPRYDVESGAPYGVQRMLWAPPLPPWTLSAGFDLASQWGIDFLIRTERWAQQKSDAIRAHKTQLPGIRKLFFEQGSPDFTLHQEGFRLTSGSPPQASPADDLFVGL